MKPIPKGARITCENGHHICTVAADIHQHTLIGSDLFEDWKHEKPNKYAEIKDIECAECGAKWIRFTENSGVELHLDEGWSGSRE